MKVIGTVTMPVAIVGVILMQLLRSEVRPLVPALQSTWLHVHVTLAMLAYAACALSFALAMMFLIQDKVKTETVSGRHQPVHSRNLCGRADALRELGRLQRDCLGRGEQGRNVPARGVRLFVTIPDLGWLMLLVFAAVAGAACVVSRCAGCKRIDGLLAVANRAVFISILLQVSGAARLPAAGPKSGQYPSLDAEGLYATSLAASPFILSALVGGIFANLLYLLLLWRRDGSGTTAARRPTRSTASPTRRFALPSPCSP